MHSFVLADWGTIGATQSITSVSQTATEYLDLSPFEDAVIWLHARDVTLGGSSAMTMNIETAPMKYEPFFSPQGGTQTTIPLNVGVQVATMLVNAPRVSRALPLSRWLRWRISATAPTSAWSATFRIVVCAHARLLR